MWREADAANIVEHCERWLSDADEAQAPPSPRYLAFREVSAQFAEGPGRRHVPWHRVADHRPRDRTVERPVATAAGAVRWGGIGRDRHRKSPPDQICAARSMPRFGGDLDEARQPCSGSRGRRLGIGRELPQSHQVPASPLYHRPLASPRKAQSPARLGDRWVIPGGANRHHPLHGGVRCAFKRLWDELVRDLRATDTGSGPGAAARSDRRGGRALTEALSAVAQRLGGVGRVAGLRHRDAPPHFPAAPSGHPTPANFAQSWPASHSRPSGLRWIGAEGSQRWSDRKVTGQTRGEFSVEAGHQRVRHHLQTA